MKQKETSIKTKLDEGSIRNRIWRDFILFIVIILTSIWLMQNVFLNTFYSKMKIREINRIGDYITNEFRRGSNVKAIVTSDVVDITMNISISDSEGNIIYPVDWFGQFYNRTYDKEFIKRIQNDLKKNPNASIIYENALGDYMYDYNIYASYLGQNEFGTDLYLTVMSPIGPIDSTAQIMRQQFPFIIGIGFIIAMIFSYFISERLSKPIVEMNNKATEFSKGNYDVKFPHSGVYELDELSDTLEESAKELSRMEEMRASIVANVSHDLKTPLTVIKSYSEMIKDITGNNEEMRNENLDTIISEADRLTEMVNSILDVSKLEMQMDDIKKERVSLEEISKELIDRFRIFETTEDIKFEIEKNSDGIIYADKELISQAIYNLASNALTFIGEDKKIIFKIDETDEKIKYSVIDHGIGMDPKTKEKIWERYYTKKDNHIRNVVGTGLGLHIVRVIFQKHGYEYGVISELGEGSEFYFIADKYGQ